MDIVFLVAGLAILFVGGELTVRGAVGLARFLGVSPAVIGLTVVGFGTSAPELVVLPSRRLLPEKVVWQLGM